MFLHRMHGSYFGGLRGITPQQRDTYLSQLYSAQAQLSAAQAQLTACYAGSVNGNFCSDSNITMAVEHWQSEVSRLQSLLMQPVDYAPPSAPTQPSSSPMSPAPVVTSPAQGGGAITPAPTVEVQYTADGSPIQTEVQTFSGDMLLPGQTAAGGASDGKGWLALLAAGAALMLGS